MQQSEIYEPIKLESKLKAQIIKQIFKDLGPKNLKGVEFFYLILKKQEMQMQFTSSAKDIFISIILKRDLFQHYLYNRQRPSLHKYSLDDFSSIVNMFENNKLLLDFILEQQKLIIRSNSGRGFCQFVVIPMNCNQDDQDFILEREDLRPNQERVMDLKLHKVGIFQGLMSNCRSFKLETLWFRFQSCQKKLEVTDKEQNHTMRWLLNVEDCQLHNRNRHMQFDCKTLSCALNLLPNDSVLILTFYEQFMVLDVPQKQKSFAIRLHAKVRL